MRKIKWIHLICLSAILLSCFSRRIIKVKITELSTGLPVENIDVYVGNIEHSSSATQVKKVTTNSDGVADIIYNAARKDAIIIRIELIGSGYHAIGDREFRFLDYKKRISLDVQVEK